MLGVLTVAIPCGVTLAMEGLAVASESPGRGAAIMAAFTLGTSPLFFVLALLATRLSRVAFRIFQPIAALTIVFFWIGRPRYRAAVATSVLVQGAVGMMLQVVLILTFQILQGFAYLLLALIIAFFMAGLACGTLWVAAASRQRFRARRHPLTLHRRTCATAAKTPPVRYIPNPRRRGSPRPSR